MRHLHRLTLLSLLIGCSSPVEPPVAEGQWGSSQAGLVITRAGGNLTLQCGTGRIDSTWTLTSDGEFSGTGATFAGGGPDPIGGRPPQPSRFTGRITGDTFTLSAVIIATNVTIGPVRMQRNGPMISQICL
jgi:hypothetical protein